MAKVIRTTSGIPITITPKMVEFGKNPHNWEYKMFPMNQIERVDIAYDGELKIVTRSGSERIMGRDISMEQAKKAYDLIKSHMFAESDDDNDTVYAVIYDVQKENEELKKKISQLESLVGDLIKKTSVKSVPEGDLLG